MRMSVMLLHALGYAIVLSTFQMSRLRICVCGVHVPVTVPLRGYRTRQLASRRAHMQRQRERAQRARTRQKIERSSSATVLGGWTDFCARHLCIYMYCISKFSSMTSELYCFDQHRWRYNTSAYTLRPFLNRSLTFFNRSVVRILERC